MTTETETEINIALIGVAGVGKTSFLKSLKNEKFDDVYKATEGFYMNNKYEIYKEKFKLVFYDFSGIEMYCSYTHNAYSYINFDFIIVMIDYRHVSFTLGKKWYKTLKKKFPMSKSLLLKNIRAGKDENKYPIPCIDIDSRKNIGIDKVIEDIISLYN